MNVTDDTWPKLLPRIYDALVDWPKRLAHESPFYRRWFERQSVRRVVDVACGTGHHAAEFHRWGLHVEGSDLAAAMIERAARCYGSSEQLRWLVRSFDQPVGSSDAWDAVICVGNSLALATDLESVKQATGHMLAAVRSGGIVVLHVLNLWRMPDGPCRWQKCKTAEHMGGRVRIVKGVHRCGTRGYVDVLVTAIGEDDHLHAESLPFWGLESSWLQQTAADAGAESIEIFGGYQEESYDRETSTDLILVAVKA